MENKYTVDTAASEYMTTSRENILKFTNSEDPLLKENYQIINRMEKRMKILYIDAVTGNFLASYVNGSPHQINALEFRKDGKYIIPTAPNLDIVSIIEIK